MAIGNQLLVAGNANVTVSGNTTIPVEYGHHSIVVYATDISGGTYASETVDFTVSIPYDFDGDGTVDISDIVMIAAAYGSTPEDSQWNPNADVAYPFGKIDIYDLASVVFHYGETL